MKAQIALLALLLSLVSCGKGSSSGSGEKNSLPLALEAQAEALYQKLLQKNSWSQRKLMLALVEAEASTGTLQLLDQRLNINCNEEQQICTISAKGN